MKNIRKREEGFTIIEVLIVLAIAGLIMVIVFLAVPALQRNSRNTQRKNDVAGVASAVNEYISNHNGTLPTATANYSGQVNLGFYTTGNISQASGNQIPVTDTNTTVRVVTGARCNTGTGGTIAGSQRQFAIQYAVETGGGGNSPLCQEG